MKTIKQTSISTNLQKDSKAYSMYLRKVVLLVFIAALIACEGKQTGYGFKVHHTGALRTIMSGDLAATVSLDSLAHMQHLYALGAVEKAKGEIQIFDGNPIVSKVVDGAIATDHSFDCKAALLVYAQIPNWESIAVPQGIGSAEALQTFVQQQALEKGIETEKPFPFLLEGRIDELFWHIIDWPEKDTVHTHEKHKKAGLNGRLTRRDVSILGFFSLKHKAVFTHHSSYMHMHFKTGEDTLAGHVDDLQLGEQMILKLPGK